MNKSCSEQKNCQEEQVMNIPQKIANKIESKILDGTYSFGEYIPSVRQCAKNEKSSKSSVLTAFSMLQGKGYIVNKPGKGYMVVYKGNAEGIPSVPWHKQFDIVTKQSGIHVLQYDIKNNKLYRQDAVNEGFGGRPVEEDVPDSIIERGNISEDCIKEYRAFFTKIRKGKTHIEEDFLIKNPNPQEGKEKEYRWYRHTAVTEKDETGKPLIAIITYFDCTEQRAREFAYEGWQRELELLPKDKGSYHEWNLTRDICEKEEDTEIPFPEMVKSFGFDERAKSYCDLRVHDDDYNDYITFMDRARLIGQFHRGVYTESYDYRDIGDGVTKWRRITIRLIPYPDSNDIKAYLMLQDIDEEKRKEIELVTKAQQDALTGVLNRKTFIDNASEFLSKEEGNDCVFMMLDIDGFKAVNDQFGHDIGDKVLSELAASMRSVLRSSDFVGRLGGDEFMICLPNMNFEAAISAKAMQLSTLLHRKIGDNLTITVSIGIAVYPRDGREFYEIYKKADTALYSVKNTSKNGFAFYSGEMLENKKSPKKTETKTPMQKQEPSKKVVLIASTCEDEMLDTYQKLNKDYFVIMSASTEELEIHFEHNYNIVVAIILDMDSKYSKRDVFSLKNIVNKAGMPLMGLGSRKDEDSITAYSKIGIDAYMPKPVGEKRIRARIESSASMRAHNEVAISSAYSNIQSVEEQRYREVLEISKSTVFLYDIISGTYRVDLPKNRFTSIKFDGKRISEHFLETGSISKKDAKRLDDFFDKVSKKKSEIDGMRIKIKGTSGKLKWFDVRASLLDKADTMTPKLLIVLRDIDEEVSAEEALRYRAERDTLTGLYTREAFFKKTREMISDKPAGYYVLTVFDIDNFKVINDQHGTAEGDEVLRRVADLFAKRFGDIGGIAARISADNFAVLYPSKYMESEELKVIRKKAKYIGGHVKVISYTIARYIVDDLSLSISSMYDRAILAQSTIKGKYGENTALYKDTMLNDLLFEQEIVDDTAEALEKKQFEVWLQPQYNHATGSMIGAEALVRWRHPTKGLISPDIFVPLYEKNGFIYSMDQYVWDEMCSLLRRWIDEGRKPLPIALNVSRHDIFQLDFYEKITELVEKYNLPPELIKLEITESAFSRLPEHIVEIVDRLHEYGFTIEIDDFGSGFSSLNTLKDVECDVLKLDMKFLRSVRKRNRGGNIVESIVRMAKWLGVATIAEGVETVEQADYLKSIGCIYVQGYLYARPMPIPEYVELWEQSEQENETKKMETLSGMDADDFWDPDSLETLVFNRFSGGAAVFEYKNGKLELLRINEKYIEVLGVDKTEEEIFETGLQKGFTKGNYDTIIETVQRAINLNEEAGCTVCFNKFDENNEKEYIQMTFRRVATAGNRHLIYNYVENVTSREEATERMTETSKQLLFLNDVSREILSEEEAEKSIDGVLNKILEYFKGVRAYVFEFDRDNNTFSNTHEVCKEGVAPEISNYKNVPMRHISYWLTDFEKENHIFISHIDSMKPEQRAERGLINVKDINSIVMVPLYSDGKLIGFMGVDNPSQNRENVANLEALGDYVSVILMRRDLNAKLKNDNKTLRTLLNDMPGGFAQIKFMGDSSTRVVFVNDTLCNMLGISREEAGDRYANDVYKAVHPDDIAGFHEQVMKAMRNKSTCVVKFRMLRKDGTYMPVITYGHIVENDFGDKFFNGYYLDAGMQTKAEEQQKVLLDSLPFGTAIYEIADDEIRMRYINREFLNMLGLEKVRYKGAKTILAIHPDDRKEVYEKTMNAVKEKQGTVIEYRIRCADGEYINVSMDAKIGDVNERRTIVYATFSKL